MDTQDPGGMRISVRKRYAAKHVVVQRRTSYATATSPVNPARTVRKDVVATSNLSRRGIWNQRTRPGQDLQSLRDSRPSPRLLGETCGREACDQGPSSDRKI